MVRAQLLEESVEIALWIIVRSHITLLLVNALME